jgi:hypothetical protein
MMSPYEKNQNPLQIRVGDTVEIKFNYSTEPAFLADVQEVTDRVCMGQDACITYLRHDGTSKRDLKLGMDDVCSVSHVTKISSRAPYVVAHTAPKNIFAESIAERRRSGRGWIGHYKAGGLRIGYHAHDLALLALASAHDELVRPFDHVKFNELWAKAAYPGLVTSPDEETYPTEHYTCVHWKAFKRFVFANRHRFLCTRKEMMEMGREYNDAMWADDYESTEAA